MARLWTSGAEWGEVTAESITPNSGGTISTVNARSGSRHFRSGTAGGTWLRNITTALGATYFLRVYESISDLTNASATTICGFSQSGYIVALRLYSDGSVDLVAGGSVIGTSAAGVVTAGNYQMFEVALLIGTGSVDYCEARVDGVSFASATALSISDIPPTQLNLAGSLTATTVDFDDCALNDSTGTAQNSWPDSGRVVLLRPISDNAVGTGWTLGTGTAIAANSGSTAVKNTPPVGVADLTAGSDTKQIRNATSNANVNYDANLTSYTTAGIGASDTVNVLVPMVATGAPVVTSAKAGTVGVSANPVIANIALGAGGTAGAFWSGVAGSTYPTGWKWSFGTTTYAPTVTLGSSPVARITQVTSSTRIADVCAMGMYVDFTPAPPAVITIPDLAMALRVT